MPLSPLRSPKLHAALASAWLLAPPLLAQDPLYTVPSRERPADSLTRVRLAPGSCGAEIPLVRATPTGEVRDTVFPAQMLDRLPAIRRLDQPQYPAEVTRTGLEAAVVLSVVVEASGLPSRVYVVRSSRNRAVDEAIRQAVLRGWYWPAQRRGRAVAVWICQTVAVSAEALPG